MSFSKNKEKRSRSSSSETNNSFVKNVTSRVSGLLPATITKWFSSPSSSNTNGSAPTADATDSSTEDEAPESPIVVQPPTKRMRYSSPNKFGYYGPADANCVSRKVDTLDPCSSYNTIQSPPGRTTFTRETNFVSTPYRAPNDETLVDRTENDNMLKSQQCVSAVGPTVATKRKSLFDCSANSDASKKACAKTAFNTIRDPNQPCFKPSLLGSPFYYGRTMYGGAATSYINQPNIKQRRNALVNESSIADNTISNSTRRIMDLLEHYSSPLSEAKRIPLVSTTKNNSWNTSLSSDPNVPKVLSYKTQELMVPSIASILRVKQRSRLMDATTAARQIIASHSSTMHEYSPYPLPNNETDVKNKFTTKVKSKLSKTTRGDSSDLETNLQPVNLPEAVLQIDQSNLPKFSFEMSTSKAPCTTSTPKFTLNQFSSKTSETKTTSLIADTPEVPNKQPFEFSSPVKVRNEEAQPAKTPPKFSFGSPERSLDQPKINENKDYESSVVGVPTENKLTTSKSKNWQCGDCWVFNETNVQHCVCCGGKKPSKYNNQTKSTDYKVTDSRLSKDESDNCVQSITNNINKPLIVKKSDSSKWNCKDCWVDNDENAQKCVCCGASNPHQSTNVSSGTNRTGSQWKCDECWINNKGSDSNCAACGIARPGAKPTASSLKPTAASAVGFFNSPSKPPDNTFNVVIAKQADKWECPGCLVRNDNDKSKCACCDHEKPGTEATKEAEQKFNFGVVPAFKFGISTQSQEAAKPAEVKAIADFTKRLQESETNNNVLPKTSTFTFGLPAEKSDPTKKETEKTDGASKLNFSFEIPKSTPPTASPTNSIFGNLNKTSTHRRVTEDEEKPQEVPKILFSAPQPQEPQKNVTSLFTSPLNKQTEDKQPSESSTLLSSSVGVQKNELTSNMLTLQSTVAASETAPKPTFMMPAKSSSSLFVPSTATAKSISFLSPVQPPSYTASTTSTTTTTTTTTSFFQPAAAETTVTTTATSLFTNNNASVGSLFQNPATVTTTTPSAFVSTTPLFNFGNNNQTSSQQENPKFNFTFGSNNNTQTPSPFKPTFNASTENKFAVGANAGTSNGLTHTSLGGGNGLSAVTPLSGGNGLSMSSPLGGNIMSSGSNLTTNTLGASEGPSNPLPGNALQPASGGIFGTVPAVKENMWSTSNNNNNANLFVSNTGTTQQKPAAATFTFGSATPAFGNNNTPAFGSNAQPPVFGMTNQNASNPPSMFASPTQSQPASVFGATPPASNPAPSVGMFGTPAPSVGATPTFGTPNQSIPSFEAPSLTAGPAPAFNFGSTQQQTTVFGFGQEPSPQQAGAMYNFGGATGAPQFNIGNPGAPQPQRRFRKAVRRNR